MDICPSDALPRKFGTHTQHFDVKWNPNEKRIALVPVGRRSRSVAMPPRRRLPWHPCRVPCGPRGSRCLPFPGRARCVRGRAESPRRRRRRDLPRRQGRHGQRHAGGEGRGGADGNALDGQPRNAYPPPPPRSTGGSRPPPSTSPAEATVRLLGGLRQQQPRSRPAVAATRRPLLPSRGRERGGERMASAPADHPAEPPPPTTARVRTGFPTRRCQWAARTASSAWRRAAGAAGRRQRGWTRATRTRWRRRRASPPPPYRREATLTAMPTDGVAATPPLTTRPSAATAQPTMVTPRRGASLRWWAAAPAAAKWRPTAPPLVGNGGVHRKSGGGVQGDACRAS